MAFTADERRDMTKGSRRGREDLAEDENRRGERRRGQLNPGSEARIDSQSKASKSTDPEVAVARSSTPSGGRWKAVSRRVQTAGGHELAMSQPRL
jgi:hypothetical protein